MWPGCGGRGMDLTERVVLVTGASSGIGRATAIALADEGARVAVAARSTGKLAALADEIETTGGEALVCTTDVTDGEQVGAAVDATRDAFGGLDVLVNSAGVGHWGREGVADGDLEAWRTEIAVNLVGVMNATKCAATVMLEQGSGHLVNVSSLSGQFPTPDFPGYAASKWGLTGFTQSVLYDLRDAGIRVTLVEPGEVDTPMQPEEAREAGKFLAPEDVADAIRYAVTRPARVMVSEIEVRPTGHE